MSVTEINICKTIARFGILAFFCFGILARCASVGTPQGGPRDSLPPKVVMMTPAFGTTNFKGERTHGEREHDGYQSVRCS